MKILVILGPTASGKTRLAVRLAQRFDGEILSADSRQVYRGLDIGTGKDLDEYGAIPYHLIDVADPGDGFNLFRFQQLCLARIPEIRARGRLPILAGGTGLYLESILRGYRLTPARVDPRQRAEWHALPDDELIARLLALKPEQHNTTDLETRDRTIRAIEIALASRNDTAPVVTTPEADFLVLGLRWERSVLRERIAERLHRRLQEGMIEEVEGLLAAGVPEETLDGMGLEYRFVTRFVRGTLTREACETHLVQAIRQFAKRQETWFRRMERQGVRIHWLDATADPEGEAEERVGSFLASGVRP
ncbi:tRNA dimethylallyltransferase [Candidatus Magnetaquicoccaceae bacterium FCR-1]|uniref:tRNA dimethylallyltransferase n=1 Tax=Candidatus Magnetaquiglobus chichijimensis TaxID=3141448 RepID=A0ABQ0C625_9PROT